MTSCTSSRSSAPGEQQLLRLQIVSPAFNEAEVLPRFIEAFLDLRRKLASAAALGLTVVDDGSTDQTNALLRRAVRDHPECITYLTFAGNAGHQAALIAGLLEVRNRADVIVTMDSDLEHPFEAIPPMLDAWCTTHAMVVHAIRRGTPALAWTKRWPSALFYRVAARLTGLPLRPGQADFKLWDASAVRSLATYLPHVGSLRVFGAWIPGRHASVEYDQTVDRGRKSRFTFRKNWELAVISIIRFSHVPLKAITALGVTGLVFALGYGIFIGVATLRHHTLPGWSSTVLTIIIMGCLQLLSLGILAGYLSRIVFARDLPLYVIQERSPTNLTASAEPGTGSEAQERTGDEPAPDLTCSS